MNPSTSQIQAMMNGPSSMVVIHHSAFRDPSPSYIATPISALRIKSNNGWHPLPLVSRLGVDIQYVGSDQCGNPMFNMASDEMESLKVLTLDLDPASPTFGEPEKRLVGGAAFKFGEGEEMMSRAVLEPLISFVLERKGAVQTALASGAMERAGEEYAKVNAKEFKMHFKKFRAEMAMRHKGLGWEKTACPVVLDGDSCEACSADSNGTLMKCARCKSVLYCGRECQAGDWKAHKPFCGIR